MTEPKEPALDRLQKSMPDFTEQLGAIAIGVDRAWTINGERSEAHKRLKHLEDEQREHARQTEPLFYDLVKNIGETDTLTDIEKIALVNIIRDSNSHHLSRGSSPAENLFRYIQSEYRHLVASLKAVEKVTKRPGQPVLYFEVRGGNERHYAGKWQAEPADVSYIFTAQTDGSGLEIDTNFNTYYASGHVALGITNCKPDTPSNFITGWHFNRKGRSEMGIRDVTMLAGTPYYTRGLLKRSVYSLQTNPVFVGEPACEAAKAYLGQQKKSADRNLFKISQK